MRYYIIAGEASGDLHASNLTKELISIDPQAEIRGWGGDLMATQGAKIVKHFKDLAFMGFVEVLMNIRTVIRNLNFCKQDILNFKPDALILVDYPGFNLRIAKWAKQNNLKVFYYISPSVWAWKENRVENIRNDTDKLFTILPFEKAFYAKHNIEVEYEGHPLLDAFENNLGSYGSKETFLKENELDNREIIAVLPGSRKSEINHMLPEFLKTAQRFPQYQFVIAGAPSLDRQVFEKHMKDIKLKILFGKTYQLLHFSRAGIITSGTATLETALFNVPQVVCYKGNSISFAIIKKLVMKNLKYISLVNLILDKPILKELIQENMTAEKIAIELKPLLEESKEREAMMEGYRSIKKILGGGGASERIAKKIFHLLKKG